MKQRLLSALLCCALLLTAMTVASAENPTVIGKVIEIEKYGHAVLDITIEDFAAAGFTLGDTVSVRAGNYAGDVPYLNGYYVDKGEMMVRAYPGHTNIAVCINYGKFNEFVGVQVGDEVQLSLAQKGGALTLQEINNLVYTDSRADYATDIVFANFRPVVMGEIARGKLYRSASPVDNKQGRAAVSCSLAELVGVRSVMNMGNTEEELTSFFAAPDFASGYYQRLWEQGQVIVLGMPVNFSSDEFAEGIVKGFSFLAEHEPPYLVHCTEGKDRAGFASMLLGALMGASVEDIVTDYMTSYVNYYHLDPVADADKYQMLADKNVMEMLRAVAGLDKGASLEGVDFQQAAVTYLTSHGMSAEAVAALQANLR